MKAHDAFINHLMLKTRCCWAPGGRYCEEGRRLWLADKVEYVLSLKQQFERRAAVDQIRANSPEWAVQIEAGVLAGFEKKRAA